MDMGRRGGWKDVSLLLQEPFEQEEPPVQEVLSVGIYVHPNKPITPPGGCGFEPQLLPSILLPCQGGRLRWVPSAPQAQGCWTSTSKIPLSWKASSTTSRQFNSDHDSVHTEPVLSAKEPSAAPCHSPALTNAAGTFLKPPTELKLL